MHLWMQPINTCALWSAGDFRSISLLYLKAITTKEPTSIRTVTMQLMWSNPNINICLSNATTTGLHEGKDERKSWEFMHVGTISTFSVPPSSWAPQVGYIFHIISLKFPIQFLN